MPAAHHTISASSIVLGLLSFPIFFTLPTSMPPLLGYKDFAFNFKHGQLVEASLVVLATATSIWLLVAFVTQRKSRTSDSIPVIPEKPHKPALERQDSCQKHWESNHNEHLSSLKQEISQHTEKPIHPWILPPQALPGPYDPMYYPLPAPTIAVTSSGPLAKSEGRHSTTYTRLVPKSGTPPREAMLYGTMTTSTHGWRRTHWNVTGG